MTNVFNKDDINMLMRQCVEGSQDVMSMTVIHKNNQKFVELAERISQLRIPLLNIRRALDALPENELTSFRANYE